MELAKRFVAEYECLECGEEFDIEGLFFPEITLPCDECGRTTTFKVVKVTQPLELGYRIEDFLQDSSDR